MSSEVRRAVTLYSAADRGPRPGFFGPPGAYAQRPLPLQSPLQHSPSLPQARFAGLQQTPLWHIVAKQHSLPPGQGSPAGAHAQTFPAQWPLQHSEPAEHTAFTGRQQVDCSHVSTPQQGCVEQSPPVGVQQTPDEHDSPAQHAASSVHWFVLQHAPASQLRKLQQSAWSAQAPMAWWQQLGPPQTAGSQQRSPLVHESPRLPHGAHIPSKSHARPGQHPASQPSPDSPQQVPPRQAPPQQSAFSAQEDPPGKQSCCWQWP